MGMKASFRFLLPAGLGCAALGIGLWIPYVLWPDRLAFPGKIHATLLIYGFLIPVILAMLGAVPRKSGASFRMALAAGTAGLLLSAGAERGLADAACGRAGALLLFQAFPLLVVMALGRERFPALFGSADRRVSGSRSAAAGSGMGPAVAIALGVPFLLSYPLEAWGTSAGYGSAAIRSAYALRAAAWAWFLFRGIRIHRARRGLPPNLRAMRGSLYATGVGLCMPIVLPRHLLAWEHIVFITGFLWLSLAAAAHLIARQHRRRDFAFHHPRAAKAMRSLRFMALFGRVSSDLWAHRYWMLLGLASAAAVSVLALWAGIHVPLLMRRNRQGNADVTLASRARGLPLPRPRPTRSARSASPSRMR
jgi:hypothetical protein